MTAVLEDVLDGITDGAEHLRVRKQSVHVSKVLREQGFLEKQEWRGKEHGGGCNHLGKVSRATARVSSSSLTQSERRAVLRWDGGVRVVEWYGEVESRGVA